MAGPPLNTTHYGATKKIVFLDPLKQIKEGKIGYSYQFPGSSDEKLARAFKKDFKSEDFGWRGRFCPQILWFKFDDAKVPAGLTFLPSQWKTLHEYVTKWQFVASKDSSCNESSPWEVICEDLSGTHFNNTIQGKGCFAGKEVQTKYPCFGIRVLEGVHEPYEYSDFFIITNINVYEKVAGYD